MPIDKGCQTDCTNCEPVGCVTSCAIPTAMKQEGEQRTWNGTYYAPSTCGGSRAHARTSLRTCGTVHGTNVRVRRDHHGPGSPVLRRRPDSNLRQRRLLAVMSGFTSAAAIVIGLSQLKHLLGVPLANHAYTHQLVLETVQRLDEAHPLTLAIGLGSIILWGLIRK